MAADNPESVTKAGRVLSAPGGRMFSSLPPLQAGAMRGLVQAVVMAVMTEALVDVQNGVNLADQWKPLAVGLGFVALRTAEAYLDQQSVVKP
jgi:hypothetical protein